MLFTFYYETDWTPSNKHSPLSESSTMDGCLVTCNSDSTCGSFWVNWGSCHLLNTTLCAGQYWALIGQTV